MLLMVLSSKGRCGFLMPHPFLSGISGLSFDSTCLSPLLFVFCLVLLAIVSCPFAAHSVDFFLPEKCSVSFMLR